ncbi:MULTISPECIES: C40 family peptidase [unclassified Lysobacter]|uniref:C40 family peptidase n=1 Tax=unclassified Lysobacter TaxID=2635362 RepID=UPI001F25C626|nr:MULTISPECIES: C40 family peptidase [unclassified Lysobacter]
MAFALCLAALALPALAQEQPSAVASLAGGSAMSGDSADTPAPATRHLLPDAMTLPDRALLLATDLNRLLAPGAANLNKTNASAAPAGEGRIKGMLQRALALLGTPYRWGGNSPDKGFDCSGLVGYVFRNALGIELPRVSREMAKTGELISDRDDLSEGDLVFFGRKGRVDHVGIYLGEGRFVHAPRTGKDVTVSSLDTGYWSGKFMEARRVEGI